MEGSVDCGRGVTPEDGFALLQVRHATHDILGSDCRRITDCEIDIEKNGDFHASIAFVNRLKPIRIRNVQIRLRSLYMGQSSVCEWGVDDLVVGDDEAFILYCPLGIYFNPAFIVACAYFSPSFLLSFSKRARFRFPMTFTVFSFSRSAILSQFDIRLNVPSEFTTIGPR